MTRARLDGLYFLLIGSLTFLLLGGVLENASTSPLGDFKGLYYPARCLIQHHDPYMKSEVLRIFQAEGGSHPLDSAETRQVATQNPYPPTVFTLTLPLAMLPWGPAHLLWMALSYGGFIFASFLIWNLGENYAPIISGALIGFLLANSEVLFIVANAAGIAISLCVVAVWCFCRERYVPIGILCLALSLAIKPHDTGLVWLYFLLAGGVYRKRALQTLFVTVALSLPAILFVRHIAPNWVGELRSNILAYSAYGGMADPGLASTGARGLGMMVNLQTVVSVFRDDPHFYNLVSYLICIPLLLVWAFVTMRSRPSPKRDWLALAAIAALTMLPVYHRTQDTKLLLLAVPACAMLWAEGGRIGRLALLVTFSGIFLTSDLPWVTLLSLIASLHLPSTSFFGQMVACMQMFPVPLILLLMVVFYLCIYASHCSLPSENSGSSREIPLAPARLDSAAGLKKKFGGMIPDARAIFGRKGEQA